MCYFFRNSKRLLLSSDLVASAVSAWGDSLCAGFLKLCWVCCHCLNTGGQLKPTFILNLQLICCWISKGSIWKGKASLSGSSWGWDRHGCLLHSHIPMIKYDKIPPYSGKNHCGRTSPSVGTHRHTSKCNWQENLDGRLHVWSHII